VDLFYQNSPSVTADLTDFNKNESVSSVKSVDQQQ
jgi:hypothetical protein